MTEPTVSVVVASGAGGKFLFRCLTSLAAQSSAAKSEIIVVDRTGPDTRQRILREYPGVQVLASPERTRATVPMLRRIGAEHARGDIVAVLEEHCTAPPHWIATIQRAFEPGDAALGGPILDDRFTRVRDWVVYFSEYHNYLPPWPDGDREALNGANIAYSRAKLLQHRAVLDEGYWEVVLHPLLRHDGRFRAVDAMGVHHTGPFDYLYYLHQRYLLSRVWGGTQKDRVPAATRWMHLLAGPVFPVFLGARVTRRVMASRALGRPYAAAFPLLVPVWIAYAWGEWLGYLRGPGNALESVE
jgi:glycosyltransferase involved in cell wall biosynthesis